MSNCVSFANSLGLQPEADGLFIGRILGFPIGLKFIDPTGMPLLLFEVRHWLKADSSQLKSLSYDEEITKSWPKRKSKIECGAQLGMSRLCACGWQCKGRKCGKGPIGDERAGRYCDS